MRSIHRLPGWSFVLTATVVAAAACGTAVAESAAELNNPFFAMDNAGGSIELLAELGYDGQSGRLAGDAKAEDVVAHAEALEARGLEMTAVYTASRMTPEGLEVHPELARTIEALAGRDVIVWLNVQADGVAPRDAQYDELAVAKLREIAELAAEADLRLALYPHTHFWIERIQDAVRVAKKVDRPNLGVSLVLCHALRVGDGQRVPELVREAAPRLFIVTLAGADADGESWQELIQPIGQGSYDLRPLLTTLREIDYDGPIGFIGYGIEGDRRELLSTTINAWRQLAAEGE